MSDSSNGDAFMHQPLPYLVTARVVVSDDAVPERQTVKVTAYSVFEAMLQVTMQIGSGFADERVTIEKIEPDIEGYVVMLNKVAALRYLAAAR